MIKYYDTLAAYEADAKSAFESQVSLIGADNAIKYDGRNVVVDIRSAKTGTIAVLDGTHALRFISVDTFSSSSFPSNFEVVGVVRIGVDHPSFRGQIAIMYPTTKSLAMSAIYQWRLTGYTLDGTDRTGTLSIRQVSDSWAANHDYVISYNATTAAGLVEQLNAFFEANEPFTTQQWVANLNADESIDLLCKFSTWQQVSYNKGASGFTTAANLLPGWVASSYMLRKNGYRNSEGTITNWSRALAYFRNDNSSTTYNPSSDVTSVKRGYPICLPGYLGTSQYQSDHCVYLRSVYGEGEQGWLKFMASFLPVRPTEYGSIGDKKKYGDARKNTYYLASQTYTDINGATQPVSPAAAYAASIAFDHELLKKGQWVLPDSDLLFDVVGGLEYPTTNDRNADVINRALKAIGAPALGNNSFVLSCSRFGMYDGWVVNGYYGYASGNYLNFAYLAVPLLLLDVPQSAQ